MHVAHVLAARLHVMVYGVRCNAANLHEPVVLNKYCITGEVAMDYWRRTGMQITGKRNKNGPRVKLELGKRSRMLIPEC